MFHKDYTNFVRPASPTEEINNSKKYQIETSLSGEEVKRIYLAEVSKPDDSLSATNNTCGPCGSIESRSFKRPSIKINNDNPISDHDLLSAAQRNDVETIKDALNVCPDKIRITDDYGWSLLMIACQANSIDAVKELLKRDVDTTVRDKAGNSAQSLVIQNKNFVLADILVSHKRKNEKPPKINDTPKKKVKLKEFNCSVCNQTYPDEQEHLSSTVHNLNTSKGKKIPACYVIPQTNRGYQIMLKVGWDRESGLGPEGAGNKYPIKATQNKDRKGLGHEKKRGNDEVKEDPVKHRKNKRTTIREYESNKKMEINFRREFY
ncbi:G patch domain and ankyrin repeat-containing protein 1 homolog [Choristoneura fumiferana]|uniref:G patch domain and ankyrin repeat-containing protein 1 homolog n=1 Tax=Choristoneura fumiferana TaxID=7141 RepID=UPI003D15A5F6